MKILKKVLVALAVLVALFFAVGLLLPSKYGTERSVEIEAPPEEVFDHVNNLQANQAWSPWAAMDPSLKVTYSSTAAVGEGAWYEWKGEASGNGRLTILKSIRPKRIENELDFKEQGKGMGFWTFEPTEKGTVVTWRMEGDAGNDIIGRWFGLMIDTLVGPQFEDGLARLAKVSEGR